MHYSGDPYYKSLPKQEQWVLGYLYWYAEMKLRTISGEKSYFGISVDTNYIESDRRRNSTVRKHLESLGLVIHGYSSSLEAVASKVETLLPSYQVPPVMDLSGMANDSGTYGGTHMIPAKNLLSCYVRLQDLSNREMIYVYLHRDEYDIRLTKSTYNGQVTLHTRLYQKDLVDTLKENILKAHAIHYTHAHLPEVLRGVYEWPIKALHDDPPEGDDHQNYLPVARFDDSDVVTDEELTKRISQAARQVRFLRRSCRELLQLRRHLREHPIQELYDSAQQYILEQSPIWVNRSDRDLGLFCSEDQYRKDLASMYLHGEPPIGG